jgi:GTP-binding protein
VALTVAIVGRPNVGKSTLFNRLVGKRLAIVDDTPGVTRDRRFGEARLADLSFTVVDTPGFEDEQGEGLMARMRRQTERAVAEADLALLVVDARAGLTPLDSHFAAWLRKSDKPVLLVANKSESGKSEAGRLEAFSLGFGEPIAVSAEHGEGMADLYEALAPRVAGVPVDADDEATEQERPEELKALQLAPSGPKALQLAIVGRPNVGKSTLINRLVGEERLLVGPEAGITRDAIAVEWLHRGRPVRLVDTAGMRRRAKVVEKLEKLSTEDSLRAIRYAQVVVLVLDSTDLMEKQDLTIARMVEEEGRVLIIAVNKWDLVEHPKETLGRLGDRLQTSLPQCRGLPVLPVSAKTGRGLDKILDEAFAMVEVWSRRISTPALNRWLEAMEQSHPPPLVKGRRLKLRYVTQTKSRPPSFALFCNLPSDMPESYLRYLVNGLRERFELPGVPIRIELRRGDNPYVKRGQSEKFRSGAKRN